MKPTPRLARCIARPAPGASMMLAPSASSTSALPDFDDTERLPCLATRAPAAAATNIDAVEMLNVCDASPPVPTMSTSRSRSGTSTLVANSRITCAAAAISPIVSFLTRSPTVSAAIITGVTSPLMIRRISDSISSWKISRCSIVRWSASCSVMAMVVPVVDAFASKRRPAGAVEEIARAARLPCSVRIASGWNCTPSTGSSRWRTPMISPSSVVAVTSSAAGRFAALDRERVVARRLERRGQAREHAVAVVRRPATACRASRAARGRSCRRTPGRSPGGRGRRRGSESCRRSAGSAAPRCPPSFGVQGPGEMTICSGASAATSSSAIASLRTHAHVRAELAQVLDEVVGEAVVVVDHQQHGWSVSSVDPALSRRRRRKRCRQSPRGGRVPGRDPGTTISRAIAARRRRGSLALMRCCSTCAQRYANAQGPATAWRATT